ncbi:MAG: NADH-quinone oxidoreductase subunit J [Planctomycetes bacterium]|nr:NADH-quinone oxidoreductase subunit J [Planctomycetota bacterium]
MEYVIFFLLAGVSVFGALNVILQRNPVISALNLVLTILSLAGLYITLEAEFLAAVQIIVYAGAIMILFLFVILLVNLDRELWEDFSIFKLPTPVLGGILGLVLVLLLFTAKVPLSPTKIDTPDPGSGKEVGRLLFTEYALPFEIASVVLFAGMVGAIILAKKRRVE